jgi:hypothetical protein
MGVKSRGSHASPEHRTAALPAPVKAEIDGKRLHPLAIAKEIKRRVKDHKATHPETQAHAAARASRTLR